MKAVFFDLDDTLYDKGRTYHEVLGADKLHDGYLLAPYSDTHGYGIADKEKGYCKQYAYDRKRHIAYHHIDIGKDAGRGIRTVYVPDAVNGLQI